VEVEVDAFHPRVKQQGDLDDYQEKPRPTSFYRDDGGADDDDDDDEEDGSFGQRTRRCRLPSNVV